MDRKFAFVAAATCMFALASPAFAKSASGPRGGGAQATFGNKVVTTKSEARGPRGGGSATTNDNTAGRKLDKNGRVIKPWCKPPVIFGTHCRHVPDPRPR